MTSAADIIEDLLSRQQGNIVLERRTGLPYGWGVWLRSFPASAVVFGAADVAEVMGRRPPVAPGGVLPRLSPWQALRRLWWQDWEPAPADQRGLRWLAALCSALLHLLFALFLVWVALVRTSPPLDAESDGERVAVAYIGRGTPERDGGGTPDTAAATVGADSASPQHRQSDSSSAQSSAEDNPQPTQSLQPVQREPLATEAAPFVQPTPPVAQLLRVTEVAEPVSDFVLPPPNTLPPKVDAPQLRMPELQVRSRPVDIVERPPSLQLRAPTALQPEVAAPQVLVREREIQIVPRQSVVTATLPEPEPQTQLRTPEIAVREVQIPAAQERASPPASAAASLSAPPVATSTTTSGASPPAPTATTTSTSKSSATTTGTSPGAGPRPRDRSGGWDTPTRADDWGAAKNAAVGTAGRQANSGTGVFNADGSVRVPGAGNTSAEPKRGAPGGEADTWTRDRIADSGTWLKRPPYDYTPTSLDKYWVPNESLLAEWVRKGIKSIEIPIPGTSTRISCVVSMLQFGGGCGLSNPNMQEQPAEARPPPDIPFKQELQEDNGSR